MIVKNISALCIENKISIAMLEKELEAKNRQIESLTNLLDQQQKLQAMGIATGAEKARSGLPVLQPGFEESLCAHRAG